MTLRKAPLSFATTSGGVLAGAMKPAQVSRLKPVNPDSSMVGRSGKSELRLMRDTAIARSAPDLTCGLAVVKSASIIDTRPAITSWSAGGGVLYGTCTMSVPAQRLMGASATIPAGLPLANHRLPGLALA